MTATDPVDVNQELAEAKLAMALAFELYGRDPTNKAKKRAVDEAYERVRSLQSQLSELEAVQSSAYEDDSLNAA